MAFRAGTPYIGGLDRAFLQGIIIDLASGTGTPNPLAPTIPETIYIVFQLTFAIITPALIAGAFAERMKFSAMLWFIGLWAIFVYAPVAHWVWGGRSERTSQACGPGWLPVRRQRPTTGSRGASTSPAAPSCTSIPASPD